VSFLEDNWLGGFTLFASFPGLFAISLNPNITVRKALDEGLENMIFRRALVGVNKWDMWVDLRKLCESAGTVCNISVQGQKEVGALEPEAGRMTRKAE
jgi:hypothetical protein